MVIMDTNRDRKCLIAKLMELIMACLRSFGGSAKPKDAVAWIYKDISESNNHREGVKLAPLPTCSQFLNVIESIFSGMARAIMHNSNY